ncbi:MAG TPA: acetate--CoA ligase family protein [Methylomirabilota bacterium]|jgi:acyl-CoA synthetase (NDP forming)
MRLDALLRPRSIAILGASERPSIGRALMDSAATLGYTGRIYPINPKYTELLGRRCYASMHELPERPDVVALCVSYTRIVESFRTVAECGAAAAVIYDGGFAEHGEEGRRRQAELVGMCREAGIALCGPNCMGVLNPHDRSSVYMQEVRDPAGLAGNVALVSQSGSICIGMLADIRRFGFSHVISSGNEAVLSTAQYLEALVDDPDTRVIATFTEWIADPERYVAALDRAAAAGKPVVVLKVGRQERTRRAIGTHTGGLAGESAIFSAMLRAHRAIEVSDLDELTEVLAVCRGTRWPKGRRLAVITASGGQAELILDVATAAGLELPPLSAEARKEIERVIGPVTGDGNPLDAWGNGDYDTNMPHALATLDAVAVDAIAFCSDSFDDAPMGRADRALGYSRLLVAAAAQSAKPHYQMNMRPGVMRREQVRFLAEHGIATIGGTRQGLGAVDLLARWAEAPRPARRPAPLHGAGVASVLDGRRRATIHEHDAKRLLAQHGVPVVREYLVQSPGEARKAAHELGYPVVLKVVADDLPHRSDVGLVVVGITEPSALDAAWTTLEQRLRVVAPQLSTAGLLVQPMVSGGVEVFAGVKRDAAFGHFLAFGVGGVAIEVLRDFALRQLPLRDGDAEAMVREIRGAPLLGPVRGGPPADVGSLVRCLEALADFAWADRADIQEIDLNPIKVLPTGHGAVVVDALIVPFLGERTER